MNTLERQARNDQIVALKLRGLTYEQIEEVTGVKKDAAMLAMSNFRESNPSLREHDPIQIVDELLEGYQADLNELAVVSNSTKNDANRIGAINARMAARDRIAVLLQATGVLPRNLGKLRDEIDVRYIADRLVAILEKYELPEEAHDEVLALLGEGSTGVINGSATTVE